MASYVFSIGYEDRSNWQICKDHRLVGVREKGQMEARAVLPGDLIFVWLGGGKKPGSGLSAVMRAVGRAAPAINVPWPSPQKFTLTLPVELMEELAVPIPDEFPGNQRGTRFKGSSQKTV